ncbi:MAG: SH3 domain-containing protein [Saprospiraceae bacterium]|nr:SH3 domain-containing protein [Saprospiraceae bacterium]
MKLPRAESLILLAFLGCVALWAISKCSDRRSDVVRRVRDLAADDDVEDRPVKKDTVVVTTPQPQPQMVQTRPEPAPPPAPTQYTTTAPKPGAPPATRPQASPTTPQAQTTKAPENTAKAGSTLFVTIDGLKVRKEPGLKGETVEQLKLYDPVTFLNQKTEWKQEINLGSEKVNDHWVKIKTAAGKVGWVFGAGVHYYKMKREGSESTAGKKKE